MYPTRDFRSLIDKDPNAAIRAISREPFTEILRYWRETNCPKDKYKFYSQGIQDAVAKGRYPSILLNFVEEFPEFYSAVRDGLARHWLTFRFSLIYDKDSYVESLHTFMGPSLFIDSISGEDVNITDKDKLNLLQMIGSKYSLPLVINGKEYTVGIFLSKQAEAVAQKFHWLQRATYNARII